LLGQGIITKAECKQMLVKDEQYQDLSYDHPGIKLDSKLAKELNEGISPPIQVKQAVEQVHEVGDVPVTVEVCLRRAHPLTASDAQSDWWECESCECKGGNSRQQEMWHWSNLRLPMILS
jgi:hypothetical protein